MTHWRGSLCTLGGLGVSRKPAFSKGCTVPCFSASGRPLMGRARGACPKAREDELPPKEGGPPALLGGSFSRKDKSDPRGAEEDLHQAFLQPPAPEFSAPSRRTLGRNRPGLRHAKSDLFIMLYDKG
ncbi:hypothetical protein GWK47_025767 [Chionoecetes opilio]|uniref:Uncharacterized protein n=1 Tax=Chionoecetes opilio TaxID=41210 RepID=A0A8J8WDK3_CHIOP|nr:hypothetical protein GWK47_025767 [Chionoecetes opilio]